MPLFGYARVSTRDQDLAAQDAELRATGCAKVFKEKASGTKSDRPELAKVISRLESGDVLVVTRQRARPATCLTSSTSWPSEVLASGRSRTPGPTPPRRMAS